MQVQDLHYDYGQNKIILNKLNEKIDPSSRNQIIVMNRIANT
jgi:hypothetical protein